jgi:hypothetical protein
MPIDIQRNYDAVTDPAGAKKRQEELDQLLKEFLAKGGKIERIPNGMTGEQYRELKKGAKKKVSKAKSKK